jgi:hypothetical protein
MPDLGSITPEYRLCDLQSQSLVTVTVIGCSCESQIQKSSFALGYTQLSHFTLVVSLVVFYNASAPTGSG